MRLGRTTTAATALATALVSGLLLVLTGCGGSGDGGSAAKATTPSPSAASSTSPTPSPTPSASPTPTTPLSRFEGRPEVKALRAWAAAGARDVDAHQRSMPRARRFDTAHGHPDTTSSFRRDFDKYYPGPLPFTPVRVRRTGTTSKVWTCVTGAGFSLTRPGGPVAEEPHKVAAVFTLRHVQGAWLVDDIAAARLRCAGVPITPVEW